MKKATSNAKKLNKNLTLQTVYTKELFKFENECLVLELKHAETIIELLPHDQVHANELLAEIKDIQAQYNKIAMAVDGLSKSDIKSVMALLLNLEDAFFMAIEIFNDFMIFAQSYKEQFDLKKTVLENVLKLTLEELSEIETSIESGKKIA